MCFQFHMYFICKINPKSEGHYDFIKEYCTVRGAMNYLSRQDAKNRRLLRFKKVILHSEFF